MMLVAATLGGCGAPVLQGPLDADPVAGDQDLDPRLARGYALLLDLLADEGRVAEILAIKSPRAEIARLLERISGEAKVDRKELVGLLPATAPLDSKATGLPVIEQDARRRIENEETPALLFAGGSAFEARILLTQQKATQYAAALCRSLATADSDEGRSAALTAMADRWAALEAEVRPWLTVAPETPPTKTRKTPSNPAVMDPE